MPPTLESLPLSAPSNTQAGNPFLVNRSEAISSPVSPSGAQEVQVDTTTEEHGVERPVFAYEQSNGRPLVVDHLEVANTWQQMGYEGALKSVDAWILEQVSKSEENPTNNLYLSILEDMRQQMDIGYNTRVDIQIEKLEAWVGMMRRLQLKQQMKDSLLGS